MIETFRNVGISYPKLGQNNTADQIAVILLIQGLNFAEEMRIEKIQLITNYYFLRKLCKIKKQFKEKKSFKQ